jgi:hypothetical protein
VAIRALRDNLRYNMPHEDHENGTFFKTFRGEDTDRW